MNYPAEDLQLKDASCLCSTFRSPLHFLLGRLQLLRISTEWPSEALTTVCHDHDFYLQFEISCDKVQMRPYHFFLARPSFVLRWQPAYVGREFRSTLIFPTERDSASDFKLRQEDSVTDSSFEFQCDIKPLEEVVMEHIEKSMFPTWFLFVTDILPCKWRLFYIAQEFWSMFSVEIFVIWQIWVTGNGHKYVRNKTVMPI